MKKFSLKRILSMVLCCVMMLQMSNLSIFAADMTYSDVKQALTIVQKENTDEGIEVDRTSDDTTLLSIYNTVKNAAPTLSADGTKVILPETGDDNYLITLYGSSNTAVIAMDCSVTQPLEDMQVYLYYQVTNVTTGESLHMDDPVLVEINGLYEDTQKSINRPSIMPGIREWKGNDGTFTFGGNVVIADSSLQEAAEVVKSYIEGMTDFAVTVTTGTASAGDIYLAWDESLTVGEEGYCMDIDDILQVTAPEYVGIVYAGATITQMLMNAENGTIPKGLMRDYPQYKVRATMLDVARFYMPLEYLEEVTMYAAFFKINEFHNHINDNNGEQNYAFRIESKLYPEINSGIPADEVYSQEDYKAYQKNVAKYGIDVVTELDSPAHSRFVAAHDSSYMLTDTMIDITNADAVAFIKSLMDELLDGEDPVIQSKKFHIGIDEYDYSYADEIRNYTNEMSAYIAAKGYEPRVWCSNAKTESSSVEIANTAVQHVYLYSAANLQSLLDDEFQLINNTSKYLYIVPVTVNGCADYMDMEMCYNSWETGKFSTPTAKTPLILQPGHPLLRGSETTIWYDDKVGCSEFDYFNRLKDQVMLMAEKNWFGKNLQTSTYEDFTNRIALYEATSPLANPGRYIESNGDVIANYDFSQLDGTTVADLSGNGYDAAVTDLSVSNGALALDGSGYVSLPFQSAGYPYSVDFSLNITEAQENAVLFDGEDGTLFLNYDDTGKMGIERKGYRFVFDYEIPTGVRLDFRLVCKEEKTLLYVDGALIGEAQLYKTTVETEGSTSFVLPTERIGAGVTGYLYSLCIASTEQKSTAVYENVALNAGVTVSGVEGGYNSDGTLVHTEFDPSHVTDGEASTYTSLEYTDEAWIEVDLGAVYRIAELEVYCRATPDEFDMLISEDGQTWQTVSSRTQLAGGSDGVSKRVEGTYVDTLEDMPAARYVKFQQRALWFDNDATGKTKYYSAAVVELRVYGVQTSDRSDLQALLDEKLDLTPYSAETVRVYQYSLEMGNHVCTDPQATQEQIAWAITQIMEAKKNLSIVRSVITDRSVCPHCEKTSDEIVWQPWTFDSGKSVPSGHYYLTGNVALSGGQVKIGQTEQDTEDVAVDVVLDLNGFSLTNDNRRCFYVYTYSSLSIMDSVGGGAISGGYATASGGVIYVCQNASLELYSGMLSAVQATTSNGGVVHVAGGTFVMHSGMIYGGSALNGGNIYVKNGSVTIKGGTITGGVAATAGGNIYATASTLTVEGGLVIGGVAKSDVGGNISGNAAEVTIDGGTIRDGYAVSGGNIGMSDTSVFKMLEGLVTGGVAKQYGGNFRMNKSASTFTVSGGVITGDISVNANMTLSGSPKITLGNNNGLHLIGTKLLNISDLNSDAQIFVARTTSGVFTTGYNADTHANCFYGAVRTELSVDSTGELRAVGGTKGYCPHCGELVEWKEWTPTSGEYFTQEGHFYLPANKTDITSMIRIGEHIASDNAVVLDLNGKKLTSTKRVFYVNSELSIIDSLGAGTVTGGYTSSGGVIYTATNAPLRIYGGTYLNSATEFSSSGGLISTGGEIQIYGGYFDASNIIASGNGAAISGARGILDIYGGYFVGGTAAKGGTISYTGDNGKAFTLYGGIITGGTCTGITGGNVYIGSEAVFNMRGGVIMNGTGDTGENNSSYNGDNVYIDSGITMNMSGGYILGADSSKNGNGVLCWTESSMTLDGDATVLNAQRKGNLYIASNATLTVKEGFRGDVYAALQGKHTPAPVYGATLTGGGVQDSSEGPFVGRLFLEGSYGEPRVFGTNDNKLVVAGAAVVNEGNSLTWCQDADSGMKTFGERAAAQYTKLYATENELTLDADSVVDLNGNNITVTGSGKFYGFDSANNSYDATACGTATVPESQLQTDFTAPNGYRYIAITDENGTAFHRLDMSVTAVSLRTSTGGIYYWSAWNCDDILADNVSSYGIAYSLSGVPGSLSETGVLYTKLTSGFKNDATEITGGIMNNILSTEDRIYTNDYCGKLPIYAAPYIVVDGKEIICYDEVAYSIYDVVSAIDTTITQLYNDGDTETADTYAEYMQSFYDDWAQHGLEDWSFVHFGKTEET